MIIASIGHTEFLLEDIKQAETLMNILHDATQLDHTYIDHERIAYKAVDKTSIEIAIKPNTELLSFDEAMQLKNKPKTETKDNE